MATFTSEEVELVQNRGNDYCRRMWLGLYEGAPLTEGRDEQQIHDLMVDKYEKRRYYIDQPVSSKNNVGPGSNISSSSVNSNVNNSNHSHNIRANGGLTTFGVTSSSTTSSNSGTAKISSAYNDINTSSRHQSPLRLANGSVDSIGNNRMKTNGITISRPVVPASMTHNNTIKSADFVANFDSADIFNAANNNNTNSNNNMHNGVISNGVHTTQHQQQPSFANFDNNPVFTNTSKSVFSSLYYVNLITTYFI